MPGPGSGVPEHEFRRRDGARQESSSEDPAPRDPDGARVFAVVYRCIKDHTAIPDPEARELARTVADVHATSIRRRGR